MIGRWNRDALPEVSSNSISYDASDVPLGMMPDNPYSERRFTRADVDAEVAAALERAVNEIITSTGPTGGWLDSPKALAAAIRSLITAPQRDALDLELVRARIEEAKRNQWHDCPERCPCPQCRRFIELKRQEQEILKRCSE